MAPTRIYPKLRQSLTPALRSTVIERTESLLLRIVRANFNTQYESKTTSLAEFRDAISAHGSGSDTVHVEDFLRHVPLTDYDSYKPFMTVFDKHPCMEAELENLFAPGLPSFLTTSSSTSEMAPKVFPRYPRPIPAGSLDFTGPVAMVAFHGYKEVKEVEREPGSIVKKIFVSPLWGGMTRAMMGWSNINDDDSWMPLMMPGFVAPWAASVIKHHKSHLIIHALFTLACRDFVHFCTPFSTLFFDLARHIDEEWDMLLSCIKSGTVPDLPGVHEVHSHLQAHLHANPDRVAELREVGPPFSREGWAAHIWPKLEKLTLICSGPFATVLPQSIIGLTIAIRTPGYGSSESAIAVPHRPDDLDTFVLQTANFIEFLDVVMRESHENLHQAWELEVVKQYEIVLTTSDGLWRYRLGDTINAIGFDADGGSPVFVFSGRRGVTTRLVGMLLTDTHLTSAIQAVSPDVMEINEFTTVLDDRQSPQTVGYFVELAGTLGPNAHLAPAKLTEGLAAANTAFQNQLEATMVRYPTIRIVRSGTFREYRHWRAGAMNVGPGQVKVPVVLLNETSISWILERVIGEL